MYVCLSVRLICLEKKSKHDGLAEFCDVYKPLFRRVGLESE
jgi:hypothetical protein